MMKATIYILLLTGLIISHLSQAQLFKKKSEGRTGETEYQIDEVSDQIPELKKEARTSLTPYRYDANKVTYFVYKTFEQRKEVEVYFLSKSEYKIAFNGNAVDKPIRIEIYDKPMNYANKTLIYSKDGVKGGIFHITSTELLENLKNKKKEAGLSDVEINTLELNKVYLHYIIPAKKKETSVGEEGQTVITRTKGAMIMAMGYRNI